VDRFRVGSRIPIDAADELAAEIEQAFPDLVVSRDDQALVATGHLPLLEGGVVFDRYLVEISILLNHAGVLPVLREVGGRIPREVDRHIENDGNACLFVPDEFWYRHPQGMEIVEFIKGPITAFLVGQSLVECGRPWPNGTRPHFGEGIVEFYSSILGTKDESKIRAFLDMLRAKKIKQPWLCPCGSGRRVGNCHLPVMTRLQERIPRARFKRSLDILERSST
jgi:hypothetical protein